MTGYSIKRLLRAPLSALGVLLFAAVLSAVLCGLQAASDQELQKYNDTYHSIPVELTVTNLSASKTTNLNIPGWIMDLFTGSQSRDPDFCGYVEDVQMIMTYRLYDGGKLSDPVAGITSIGVCKEFLPEAGGSIEWFDGYDESILSTNERVCLVEKGNPSETVSLMFIQEGNIASKHPQIYRRTFKVVGTYTSDAASALYYCPFETMKDLYREMIVPFKVQTLKATLADNDQLEEFRAKAANWFAKPNAVGKAMEWGEYGYDYYPFALDINDDLLQQATATLENSMLINKLCALLVFVLSAGAGFLIGFLMIRGRKREIILLRAMGTSNLAIYAGFTFEQMLCVILGVVVGGAAFLWRPVQRLGLFVGIYFVALTVALVIFLHTNLLSSIKEDE